MTFLIPQSIETARLHLRMFTEADWEPLCQMFRDEECVRYTTTIPLTDWQTWRWMAGYLGHWHLRGYGPYAVVEKQSGRMVAISFRDGKADIFAYRLGEQEQAAQ